MSARTSQRLGPDDWAAAALDALVAHNIEQIFDDGLHEFLSWFIVEVGNISNAVHDDYLSGRM